MNKIEEYTIDKKAFRKAVRECETNGELFTFLKDLFGDTPKGGYYKLTCNGYKTNAFEEVEVYNDRIVGYFYEQGTRHYKDIKTFSYSTYIVKFNGYGQNMQVFNSVK